MKLRADYKDAFVEKHGVKLGLMSGFIKVCFELITYYRVVGLYLFISS